MQDFGNEPVVAAFVHLLDNLYENLFIEESQNLGEDKTLEQATALSLHLLIIIYIYI